MISVFLNTKSTSGFIWFLLRRFTFVMIVDFFKIIFFNSQKVITCQMLNDLISIFFLFLYIFP